MILAFPDSDTLRLAVGTGVIPAAVTGGPVAASTDAEGRPFVETDAKLPKASRDALDRFGVAAARRHPTEPQKHASWLQLFPAEKDTAPPNLSAQAPVLFELPGTDLLPSVVGEMLRLGNDRQSFRAIADTAGERVLLRVIGPPYYTLLRALDRLEEAGGRVVRAYTEQAPRVWVELGYTHPFAAKINLAAGQVLLVRAPREWQFLPDEPFRDVYDLLTFELPSAPTDWHAAPVPDKLPVPLRLAPGNAADRPELWVIRGAGLDDLDRMVRDADDRLTEQLTFAVAAAPDGETTVVLRTRPTRKEPPVLQLDGAVGYKPYWKIPNLFLPVSTRLLPTVRREQVRQLLAADTDTLVWLAPTGGGAFTPMGVSEDSFRPLADWVEYVIDANRETLAAWVAATGFDFDSFVCTEAPPKPKAPPDRPGRDKPKADPSPATTPKAANYVADAAPTTTAPFTPPQTEARLASSWKLRRDELEREFLEIDGPLDAPARLALWPELAAANSALGDDARSEAAVCWANALWPHQAPQSSLVGGWLKSETGSDAPVTAAAFDARMAVTAPTPAEVRAFTVSLLDASTRPPTWLPARLPAAQKYLEAHDRALPVRAAWLAATQLARLSGADILGLARTRDRLLRRLLDDGLSPERDLPGFLRFAGRADAERVRAVRDRAVSLHKAVRAWVVTGLKTSGAGAAESDTTATPAYTDLLFAYALAKLGETAAARALVEEAGKILITPQPPVPKVGENIAPFARHAAGQVLFGMFRHRVEQAAGGTSPGGQQDAQALTAYDSLPRKGSEWDSANKNSGANGLTNPFGFSHYVITRMREQSRVLEPQEALDPYARWTGQADELRRSLADLPSERDPQRLARLVRELLRDAGKGKLGGESRFLILHQCLPLAARVGEAFALEMIALVPSVLTSSADTGAAPPPSDLPRRQGQLFERALFLAAHFDRSEAVRVLVDQFVGYVRSKPEEQRFELVNVVAGQCLRSLRKLGLRDEIDALLRRLQDEVLGGKTLPLLRQVYAAKPDLWADALQTQLNLAAGWLTFGLIDQARPILDAARQEVMSGGGRMWVQKFVRLVQTYIAALGHGPADEGMTRMEELFRSLPPNRVTNGFSTAPYYSRYHLNLAEEVVLALVSDDFALGQAGQRWLDDDEYLVRRRIHDDMKHNLAASGV